jgi:hypothetical protein
LSTQARTTTTSRIKLFFIVTVKENECQQLNT